MFLHGEIFSDIKQNKNSMQEKVNEEEKVNLNHGMMVLDCDRIKHQIIVTSGLTEKLWHEARNLWCNPVSLTHHYKRKI